VDTNARRQGEAALSARRLGPADGGDACELVSMFYPSCPDGPMMRAWLGDPRHWMIGGYAGETPAGLAWGHQLARADGGPDMLLVYSTDVAEAHRRRGLGRAMMDELRRLKPGSMWLVTNEANEAAMRLYESAGGDRPQPDDVVFVWK